MEPQDFIDQLYLALLEQGWTLNDIDTMDIIYYLKLLNRKRGSEKVYIDSVL
jgi:hypothetical protein